MPIILSDKTIETLITEPKYTNSRIKKAPKPDNPKNRNFAFNRWGFELIGNSGVEYYVYIKENCDDKCDFSVGLCYKKRDISRYFILKRYNSPDYPFHENPIENEKIEGFHIHTATKRYQEYGKKQEEKFAEATNRYDNFHDALECLFIDCGILNDQTTIRQWSDEYEL